MRPLLNLFIVGFFSALCVPSAPGMASDDSQRLTFAWPDGLSGHVNYTLRQVSSSVPDTDTVWEGGGTARFATSRDGSATVIAYSDQDFELTANQGSDDIELINEILTLGDPALAGASGSDHRVSIWALIGRPNSWQPSRPESTPRWTG